MNSWTPLFSKIVDSSIWAEPDNVCKVFITMLALKDADHVVRFTAYALSKRCHKTEAEVIEALRVLSEPDTKRLEPQVADGRRIEKVEDGWFVINGQFYENMMRALNRRHYKAAKQREYRQKSTPMAGESAAVRAFENGDLARAEEIAGRPAEKPIVQPMEPLQPITNLEAAMTGISLPESDDEDFSGLAGA